MNNEESGPRLRRVDPAVVEADPFWAGVRRAHPDATLVLLPPDTDDNLDPDQCVPPDVARLAVRAAVDAWTSVAPLVAGRGATEAPSLSWRRRHGRDAFVVQKGVRGLGGAAGTDLLREVAHELGGAGWRLRPRTRSGRPLLDATDGDVVLRAEAGAGATVLTISAEVGTVAKADQAELLAEARSWL